MTFPLIRAELEAAGVGDGGWALTGSGAMRVAGLDVDPGDIDVFARPWVYERLRVRPGWEETFPNPDHPPMLTWHGGELEVCAWYEWRHYSGWRVVEPTVPEVLDGARRVADFWWIMDLSLLAFWKKELIEAPGTQTDYRREKDRRHLALLEAAGYPPRYDVTRDSGGPT